MIEASPDDDAEKNHPDGNTDEYRIPPDGDAMEYTPDSDKDRYLLLPDSDKDRYPPPSDNKPNTRVILWCSVISSLFTAAAIFVILYVFGYFPLSQTVNFRRGNHATASVQKLQQVWDALSMDFYEPVDEDRMIEYAAAAMAGSIGDIYTVYYPREEMRRFSEINAGIYHGIGVYVMTGENGRLRITGFLEGSPAEEAGAEIGDEVVTVDGIDVDSLPDSNSAISMIKGAAGTKVAIGVFRQSLDEIVELIIERREIKTENVFSRVIYVDGQTGQIIENAETAGAMAVGYIYLTMFDNSAYEYFMRHFKSLKESGITALIVDLRGNSGGSYDEVRKIAGNLIGKGVVVYTEDRAGHREYSEADEEPPGVPIRVLIDGNSASASEILAGAVKDNGAGRLVGVRTFGKGLVQAVLQLKDGSGLKYTRSRYFTPSGVCIQGTGIEPDVRVELPPQYKSTQAHGVPEADDTQLHAALIDILENR